MPDAATINPTLFQALERAGQLHLLTFWDSLDAAARDRLARQLADLDLTAVPALVAGYVKNKPHFALPASVEPAPYFPFQSGAGGPTTHAWDKRAMKAAGESLLRAGQVAAFVVAGGQGSRLGFDGPKGCFAAGAVTGKPLFQIFAEQILAAGRKFGKAVPWYIMTSPLNHAPTVAFFEQHNYFGLARADVMFFPQGVLPSFDMSSGKILLAGKDEIATNPDGHGGSITALHKSGALADMKRRGIRHISYFQVDNPSVKVLDPVFLGLHAASRESSAEMSSKMIPKAYPEEKLGVFCKVNGKLDVIEYSDLPPDLSAQRLPGGSLRFLAGSIAIHVMSVEFVEKLATDPAFSLPYHRAEKKITHIDPATGKLVEPTTNNGVKLERFVFDALPKARASIVYETDRVEEFAPIKNASGVDSVQSSKELQTQRAARWLESIGVSIPKKPDGKPDCTLEISPLTALEPEDLNAATLPKSIAPGAKLAL